MTQQGDSRLSARQAARHLGLSISTIWRLKKDGRLGYFELGGRVLFAIAELDALLARTYVPPTDFTPSHPLYPLIHKAQASRLQRKTKAVINGQHIVKVIRSRTG